MTETCVNMGAGGLKPFEGRYSNPRSDPEFLLLFDFSLWLISAGDAVLLMQPGTTIDPTSPWDPVTGCVPDFVGDNDWCDFPPAVNPGASGGSGGPPGSIEVAIPWSAFAGCTGCTPGFAPGVDFRFTMTVLRGTLSLDFTPDGAIEDVLTETVAGVTSLTPDSCSSGQLQLRQQDRQHRLRGFRKIRKCGCLHPAGAASGTRDRRRWTIGHTVHGQDRAIHRAGLGYLLLGG
jgi:hypothetical protein